MQETVIIFGAGASYDSLSSSHAGIENSKVFQDSLSKNPFRPPLTQHLFAQKYIENLITTKEQYQGVITFSSVLQKHNNRAGQNLEQELTTLYGKLKDPNMSNPGKKVLLRIIIDTIFYLQDLLHKCSDRFIKSTSNYSDLTARLAINDVFPTFITFNYDFLLENAIIKATNQSFNKISDYINNDFKVIKLHGSCNWAYEIDSFFSNTNHSIEVADNYINAYGINDLLNRLNSLSQDMVYYNRPSEYPMSKVNGGTKFFPAMVIPLNGENDFFAKRFICPTSHIDSDKKALTNAKRIIIIGWSAYDEHFCTLLKTTCKYPIKIKIISNGHGNDILERLKKYLPLANIEIYNVGFSNYLESSNELERDILSYN